MIKYKLSANNTNLTHNTTERKRERERERERERKRDSCRYESKLFFRTQTSLFGSGSFADGLKFQSCTPLPLKYQTMTNVVILTVLCCFYILPSLVIEEALFLYKRKFSGILSAVSPCAHYYFYLIVSKLQRTSVELYVDHDMI